MSFEKFCAKCGVVTNALVKGLCQKCFLDRKELFKLKESNVDFCVKCKKIKIKGKWGGFVNELIEKEVSSKVQFLINLEQPKVNVVLNQVTEIDFDAEISVAGFLNGVLLTQTKHYPLSLNKVSCDSCMKLVSNYREAIIQLRAPTIEEAKGMLEVTKIFLEEESAKDSLANIVKIISLPKGFDLWIGSKKGAYRVVRKLEKLFKTKIIESKKLIGEDDSRKPKYRITYCLRKLD